MMSKLFRIGPGEASLLGPLEHRIMHALWNAGRFVAVSEVVAALDSEATSSPSYSAVKAVLLNLVDKKLVRQRKAGRAKEYRPAMERDEFERGVVDAVVTPLLRSHRSPLLAHIADELLEDAESMAQFEALIARRRAERAKR
jgi:predicted transcriptional regulator